MGINGNEGATAGAKTVTVMEIHPNFKTVTVMVIFGKQILNINKIAGNNFDSNGNYGLQFWPGPELVNVTVTAPGRIPRELIHRRGRLELQSFILVEFVIAVQNCVEGKKRPKNKVFGQDIPGTSGTQTSGYPVLKLYASGFFLLFREWPGCPEMWVGTSQIWKTLCRETLGRFFVPYFEVIW